MGVHAAGAPRLSGVGVRVLVAVLAALALFGGAGALNGGAPSVLAAGSGRLTVAASVAGARFPAPATLASAQTAADTEPVQPPAPVLAWYYPQFANSATDDVAHMQRAGIDTVIVSQTGLQVGQPLAEADIVKALQGTNMTFTVGIETNQGYETQAQLIAELQRLTQQEMPDPRWLRYGDKPVLIFWALQTVPVLPGQSPQDAWASIRQQVDPDHATIWIGEGGDATPGTGTMSYMSTFDGLHLYSVAWDEHPDTALQGWERRLHAADPAKLWVATVMPGGHYGAGIVGSDQWTYRDRQDGAYLAAAWKGAIATKAAMVIVTSWNEQVERTGIYPESEDAGADPYFYADLNRQQGDAWRVAAGAPPYAPETVAVDAS